MDHAVRSDDSRLPRRVFLALAGLLALGCGVITLVPVEESRFAPTALRFTAAHMPYSSGDLIFSHATEAHAAELCDTCHFGTASEETTGIPPAARPTATVALPAMALCFKCHDGAAVSNDCILCHFTNRRDKKPSFHDGIWPQHHKEMAEREAYKCSLCHIQNDCKGCHAERKPLSHTPRFERSTHGRLATHDRTSCATCHETAFCENCHSQPPPDHTALFRAGPGHRQAALVRGRSCVTCHRFEDVCAECHRQ